MILILSDYDDPTVAPVAKRLTARHVPFLRFDPKDFPSRSSVTLKLTSDGGCNRVLAYGTNQFDLEDVTAVWHRRPGQAGSDERVATGGAQAYARAQSKAVLADLWQSLRCLHLPARPSVIRAAGHKFTQLMAARDIGFEIPCTMVTNEPGSLINYFNEHKTSIVSKLAVTTGVTAATQEWRRLTEPVTHRDLGYARSLQYAPCIFQPKVEKKFEIRVTIAGKRVFAAAIDSQGTYRTQLDWRRYDFRRTSYLEHRLPVEVEKRCLELMTGLGLTFCTIDLIVTIDDRYVFLELNPNGQWYWIEQRTGLPISDAISELLAGGRT